MNVVKRMTEKDVCSRVLGRLRERGAKWLEWTDSAESTNTPQLDQCFAQHFLSLTSALLNISPKLTNTLLNIAQLDQCSA